MQRASRSTPARPTRSGFAQRERPSSAQRSSISCATGSICPDATPIRISRPHGILPRSTTHSGGVANACYRAFPGIARPSPASSARSSPSPSPISTSPRPPLRRAAFATRAVKRGVQLDPRTRLIYDSSQVFINGTASPWPSSGTAALKRLANARALTPRAVAGVPPNAAAILYEWYRDGYLHTGSR